MLKKILSKRFVVFYCIKFFFWKFHLFKKFHLLRIKFKVQECFRFFFFPLICFKNVIVIIQQLQQQQKKNFYCKPTKKFYFMNKTILWNPFVFILAQILVGSHHTCSLAFSFNTHTQTHEAKMHSPTFI